MKNFSHFSILLWALVSCHVVAKKKKKEKKVYPDYMYGTNSSAGLVQEFINKNQSDVEHPDFIFKENNGPRVIEFYLPWCAHCRKFKKSYIALADQMNTLAKDLEYPLINFHSVSCQAHKTLCRSFKMNGYPQMKLFAPNATSQTFNMGLNQIHPLIMFQELHIEPARLKIMDGMGEHESAVQPATGAFLRTKQQIYADAHMSFDFLLRNNIYVTNGVLEEEPKKAFHAMLELMRDSLPHAWTPFLVVNKLLRKFDDITNSEAKLIEVLDEFDEPEGHWSSSCEKDQQGMGYTCGLWTLFHIITVGYLEWNRLIPEADKGRSTALAADKTAETFRNFVFHFLGCQECRDHFVKSYDDCEFDGCNRLRSTNMMWAWRELPIWLVDFHNAVNIRTFKEKATEENREVTPEDELQRLWPRRENCPKCWVNGTLDGTVTNQYLRVVYWPDDSTTDEFRSNLGFPPILRSQEYQAVARATQKVGERHGDSSIIDAPGSSKSFVMLSGVPAVVALVGVFVSRRRKKRRRPDRRGQQKRSHSIDDLSLVMDLEEERISSPRKDERSAILSPRRKRVGVTIAPSTIEDFNKSGTSLSG